MTRKKSPPAKDRPAIESIRKQIESVDQQLHALINQRAELARQVGVPSTRKAGWSILSTGTRGRSAAHGAGPQQQGPAAR